MLWKSDQLAITCHQENGNRLLRWCYFGWIVLCSGCALLPQPEIDVPQTPLPKPSAPAVAGAEAYRIVHAELEFHTYRSGWLSQLAHNHVMETTKVSGTIQLADPIEGSTARLYFRPWDLILDDPDARLAAGKGFESKRTTADIAATQSRMLGPRGFDSNEHPLVIINVSWLETGRVNLDIDLRGEKYNVPASLTWSKTDVGIQARADIQLSHRALGIKPYSAFVGAIAVADPIRLQLELSAEPATPL